MTRDPYGKLMSDSALALARLRVRVLNLSAIDFGGLADCERDLEKVKSKLENLNFHLLRVDEGTRYKISTEYQVLAETIEEYTRVISQAIQEKAWLRSRWERLKLISSFFGVVRVVLSFFGIRIPLLPAPSGD